jgi:hypothetical protein
VAIPKVSNGVPSPLTTKQAQPTPPELQPALPDMVFHAPSMRGAQVGTHEGRKVLKYSFAVGNRGPGHLVLLGESKPGQLEIPSRQVAFAGRTPVVVREGGTFIRHDDHGHFHYKDTAALKLEKDDLPGWSSTSAKSHFYMVDSGDVLDPTPIDPSIPSAISRSFQFEGKSYSLGSTATNLTGQMLTAGKYDMYGTSLNAPWLDLPAENPDGMYTLTVNVDPTDSIAETDETNNVSKFRIKVEGGRVVSVVEQTAAPA